MLRCYCLIGIEIDKSRSCNDDVLDVTALSQIAQMGTRSRALGGPVPLLAAVQSVGLQCSLAARMFMNDIAPLGRLNDCPEDQAGVLQ